MSARLLSQTLGGALALVCLTSAGAVLTDNRADEFVDAYMKRKQIPGCAIMVRHKGATVMQAGHGMANLEHDVPVTAQTFFQSASMGKQFTAFAIMLLVEEGKIALGDPVAKYLTAPKSWAGVTVRHLLTHTSGLGDYPEDFSMREDYTEDEFMEMVRAQPLAFAAGEKWSYSNLGYLSLGVIIHQVSGKFYGDFLRERVFLPLGMKATRVISEADIIPHRAAGYQLRGGELKNQKWVSPSLNTTADGCLYLNAGNMALWAEALDKEALLSHASYEQMWSPVKLNDGTTAPYGFGWGVRKTESGRRLLEHGGAWQGFASYIARYPDNQLTVVVFCNRGGASARYIAQRLAGSYVPGLAPPVHKARKLEPAALRSYAGDYRLEDRFSITLKVVDEHLETTWLGEKMIMTPETETA
ncbi:MAG: serine hydrolase domain-containing protein [Chthoniobacterales bacterium]